MRSVWLITKKELQTFFDSLIAYILLVVFVWLYGRDVFLIGEASLEAFFDTAYWSLFFLTPAISMRMIAEEKNTGTLELLLTKSITDRGLVTGKFLACLLLIVAGLILTLPYYITVSYLGPMDHGVVWSGYLGLILMSMAYIGIGLFASSISNNQIVAFLIALFIGAFFHIIAGTLARNFTGIPGRVLDYLSVSTHFDSITRGVVDSADVIFFLSLAVLGVTLTELMLGKRNITE